MTTESTNNSLQAVTEVRVYLTEGQHQLDSLMTSLHDKHKVMGVTAFRGIAGFGQSGKMHAASLLDMSLDLPIVLEFFDKPEKIHAIVKEIEQNLKPGHLITWPAQMNL